MSTDNGRGDAGWHRGEVMFVCSLCGKDRCNGHLLADPKLDPRAKVMYTPALAFTEEDWGALGRALEMRARRAAEVSDAEEGT